MQVLYVGLLLTVLGMGTVFTFLAIMVGCVAASGKLLPRFAHLMPEKAAPRRRRPAPVTPPAAVDALIPVIAAAIHRHLEENP